MYGWIAETTPRFTGQFTSHELQFTRTNYATKFIASAANQYEIGRCDVRVTNQRLA